MVAHAYNPSTQETEAEEGWAQDQTELHSKTVPHSNRENIELFFKILFLGLGDWSRLVHESSKS